MACKAVSVDISAQQRPRLALLATSLILIPTVKRQKLPCIPC